MGGRESPLDATHSPHPAPSPPPSDVVARARDALDAAAATSGDVVSSEEAALFESVATCLDPRDAGDGRRIARILWSSRVPAAPCRGFLERVAREADDPALRHVAVLSCAQIAMFGGDVLGADRLVRDVLLASRGTGSRVERTAVLALGKLALQLRREFEALVLSRRAASLMDEAHDVWGGANARLNLCAVYSLIGDVPRLSAALDEIAVRLPRLLDPVRHAFVSRSVHRRRAEVSLACGDAAEALASLRAAERVGGTLYPGELEFALHLEAEIEFARDDVDRAAELLTAAAALGSPTGVRGLRIRAQRVAVDARRGGGADAIAGAEALLRDLRSSEGVRAGPAARREFALRVARGVQSLPGAIDVARRAYDLAASAAFDRLIELDGFVREVPESASPSREDLAVIEHYRRRTERSQRVTHAAVARLVADAVMEGRMPAEILPPSGELTCVCAWCQRVRTRGGSWLTVQQFLPLCLDGAIELTHGICEACLPALRTELRHGAGIATA